MIRFINDMQARTHVGAEEISQMGWLDASTRVDQIKLTHMFKIVSGTCPVYMKENVVRTGDTHQHFTRSSVDSLVVPRVGGPGSKSFIFTSVKLWNQLPADIKAKDSILSFKPAVKKRLSEVMISRDLR